MKLLFVCVCRAVCNWCWRLLVTAATESESAVPPTKSAADEMSEKAKEQLTKLAKEMGMPVWALYCIGICKWLVSLLMISMCINSYLPLLSSFELLSFMSIFFFYPVCFNTFCLRLKITNEVIFLWTNKMWLISVCGLIFLAWIERDKPYKTEKKLEGTMEMAIDVAACFVLAFSGVWWCSAVRWLSFFFSQTHFSSLLRHTIDCFYIYYSL